MAQLLNLNLDMKDLAIPGYERVVKITENESELQAIICLHDLTLGPALGGTRIYPYATFEAALNDVLRLAKGMTYKSALSFTGFGGGKAVIIADPKKNKSKEKLLAFGEAVNQLQGLYITAEDLGCTIEDVDLISSVTPYVVGLTHDKSSGNPGLFTAWGVFRGIQSVLKKVYGSESVQGRTVAVQGLGNVGEPLVNYLFWNGAKLIISDINQERVSELAKKYGAKVCSPSEITTVSCDVFAPCAMGAVLNSQSIEKLQCRAVAGAANNQLERDENAVELMKKGILYAPDFIINAGGLINVSQELDLLGYNPSIVREKVHNLYDQLILTYEIAEKEGISTHAAAVSLGDHRLKNKIGKRQVEPTFHCIK